MDFLGTRGAFVVVLSFSIVLIYGLFIRRTSTCDHLDGIIPKTKMLQPFRIYPVNEQQAVVVTKQGCKLARPQDATYFVYDMQEGLVVALDAEPFYFDHRNYRVVLTKESKYKAVIEPKDGDAKNFYIKLVEKRSSESDPNDEGDYIQNLNPLPGSNYLAYKESRKSSPELFRLEFIPARTFAGMNSVKFKIRKGSKLVKPSDVSGEFADDFWFSWEGRLLPSSSTTKCLTRVSNELKFTDVNRTNTSINKSQDFNISVIESPKDAIDKIFANISQGYSEYLDYDRGQLKLTKCKSRNDAPVFELCDLSSIPIEQLRSLVKGATQIP